MLDRVHGLLTPTLLLAATAAMAQTAPVLRPSPAYVQPDGSQASATVPLCPTGVGKGAAPCAPGRAFPTAMMPSSEGGLPPVASTASALVAKSSAGNLYGYHATASGSAAFIAVLNASVAPAAGAAISPLECSAVPATGTYRTRQDIPDRYSNGIVLLFTSSCSTYTAVSPVLLAAVVQ